MQEVGNSKESQFDKLDKLTINSNIECSLWKHPDGNVYVDIRHYRFKKPTRKGVRFPANDLKIILNDLVNIINKF
jgi:hypothetical protein